MAADGQDGQDGADGQDGQDGADGREVELQVSNGYIQWRYEGRTLVQSALPFRPHRRSRPGWSGWRRRPGWRRRSETVRTARTGVTPQLRINSDTNQWEVSYDNGATWASLGVAPPALRPGWSGRPGWPEWSERPDPPL